MLAQRSSAAGYDHRVACLPDRYNFWLGERTLPEIITRFSLQTLATTLPPLRRRHDQVQLEAVHGAPAPVHLPAMDAVLCECALVRPRSDGVWHASFVASAIYVLFRAPEGVFEQERQPKDVSGWIPDVQIVNL